MSNIDSTDIQAMSEKNIQEKADAKGIIEGRIEAIKTAPYDDENERLKALTKPNNDFIVYQGLFHTSSL